MSVQTHIRIRGRKTVRRTAVFWAIMLIPFPLLGDPFAPTELECATVAGDQVTGEGEDLVCLLIAGVPGTILRLAVDLSDPAYLVFYDPEGFEFPRTFLLQSSPPYATMQSGIVIRPGDWRLVIVFQSGEDTERRYSVNVTHEKRDHVAEFEKDALEAYGLKLANTDGFVRFEGYYSQNAPTTSTESWTVCLMHHAMIDGALRGKFHMAGFGWKHFPTPPFALSPQLVLWAGGVGVREEFPLAGNGAEYFFIRTDVQETIDLTHSLAFSRKVNVRERIAWDGELDVLSRVEGQAVFARLSDFEGVGVEVGNLAFTKETEFGFELAHPYGMVATYSEGTSISDTTGLNSRPNFIVVPPRPEIRSPDFTGSALLGYDMSGPWRIEMKNLWGDEGDRYRLCAFSLPWDVEDSTE